jgi:hypothetical protein
MTGQKIFGGAGDGNETSAGRCAVHPVWQKVDLILNSFLTGCVH